MSESNGDTAIQPTANWNPRDVISFGLQRLIDLHLKSDSAEVEKNPRDFILKYQLELDGLSEFLGYDGKSFPELTNSKSVSVAELVHLIDTKIEYVIEPLCPKGTLTLVQGMPKSGKSTFSLWVAICAAMGLWPSEIFKIQKPFNVLFVEFEDSPLLVMKRTARYLAGAGWDAYEPPANLTLCDNPTLWLERGEYEAALTQEIKDKKYELVVIDTLSYVHQADDENDSAQMKLVMASLKRMVKATGCSIIMIHHSGKGAEGKNAAYKARGSSAISAAADVILDWGDRKGLDVTPVELLSKYDDSMKFEVEYRRVAEGIQWLLSQDTEDGEPLSKKEKQHEKALKILSDLLTDCPSGAPYGLWVDTMVKFDIPESTAKRYIKDLSAEKRVDRRIIEKKVCYTIMQNPNP